MEAYRQLVQSQILDQATFVRAVFGAPRRGHDVPWKKVVVRPVVIKGEAQLQISYFDERKDITKNYVGAEAVSRIGELLDLPFSSIYVQRTDGAVQVRVSKKGKVLVRQHAAPTSAPSFEHDRRKELLLPSDRPDPFLQGIGLMTQEGKIRADRWKKFRQINAFLRLVVERRELERIEHSPIRIVDCGCGNAYLTFAVYHYLNHILGLPAQMVGVDANQELLRQQVVRRDRLGWPDLSFETSTILAFQPAKPPDMVLALHACDTATDEALAQAVRWHSRMIFSVPCCHHHLQQQLSRRSVPAQVRPMLEHGILRERLGDILTDTARALILRMLGYRSDVVQFISREHTDKNLMIRAIWDDDAVKSAQARREYEALKEFWQVEPYLETLLGKELENACG